MLLSVNGQVSGYFAVSEEIRTGNFLLQAHTNYNLNFGPDSYFYKHLKISRISGSSIAALENTQSGRMVADASFLPEGGVLLENTSNLIAFKANDKYGFGVDVNGKVKDEKGNLVTTFSSDYNGMGLLFLSPEPEKSYVATIDGFPSFRYEFKPVKEGIKIQLVNHTSKEVILNISGNNQKLSNKLFYLVNMYRGEVLFYQSFTMEGVNKVFKFESSSFKPGINRLVLLDKEFNIISERFLFSEVSETDNLVVESDKNSYEKKSKVRIQIKDNNFTDSVAFSNLSVLVVHELVVPEKGFSKNLKSQLLVDSEIKGFVESSADLFNDTEISSEAKLRLLMLTIKSDRYFWNTAPAKSENIKYEQESGINLKGIARNTLTKNVIRNGEITAAIQKDAELAFLTTSTDSLGNFLFPGLLFSDTAEIYVQAKTEDGKMNIDVDVEPVFDSVVPAASQLKILSNKATGKSELAALKYNIFNEKRKANSRSKASKRKKDRNTGSEEDGHIRLYESADFVLEVEPDEQSYSTVLDFMTGKIPGVDISGDNIKIRGTSSFGGSTTPLFLLDGVPLVGSQSLEVPQINSETGGDEDVTSDYERLLIQTIQAIPLKDVDKIEVLKSSQKTAIFGVKGANGVIAIYTRRGIKHDGTSIGKGIVEKKVIGYLDYRKFYSPTYNPENENEDQLDLRTLLLWNPELVINKDVVEVVLYSSEQTGKYIVFVEGISNDGEIYAGKSEFEIK